MLVLGVMMFRKNHKMLNNDYEPKGPSLTERLGYILNQSYNATEMYSESELRSQKKINTLIELVIELQELNLSINQKKIVRQIIENCRHG